MIKAVLALITVNVIYGGNYIIAKDVMPEYVGPSGFVAMRVIGALVMFWLIRLFIRERVRPKHLLRMAVCGLFGVALNQLFFFEGLSLTSPINSAIIMTANPIMVLIIAAIMIKERITRTKVAGIFFGCAGAIGLISVSNLYGGDTSSSVTGDIFIVINAFSYAMYLVLVKPLMATYKPLTVISWVFLFGSAFVIPYGYHQLSSVEFTQLPTDIIWAISYVVIGVTFLAYLLNIFALKIVTPGVSSSFIYLQPVMTFVFALIHAEIAGSKYASNVSWEHVLCTLSIFLGVYLVTKNKR